MSYGVEQGRIHPPEIVQFNQNFPLLRKGRTVLRYNKTSEMTEYMSGVVLQDQDKGMFDIGVSIFAASINPRRHTAFTPFHPGNGATISGAYFNKEARIAMLRDIYAKLGDGERLDFSLDPFYLFINLNSKDKEINTSNDRDLTPEEIEIIKKVKLTLVFPDSSFTSNGHFFEARGRDKPSIGFKFFHPLGTPPIVPIDKSEVPDLLTSGLDLNEGLLVCISSNPDQIAIIEGRFAF